MRKKVLTLLALILLAASGAPAQINGSAGGWADYNSNAFNDALGGGTLTLGAFLDIAADWPFGDSPLSLSADYSGSYSAYLSYFERSHNDHWADALLVFDIGERGYLALGGAFDVQANSPDRKYYNNSSGKGVLESKAYLADPVLIKMEASVGRTVFSYFTDYDYKSTDVTGSLSLFLPTKTALIPQISFSNKRYSSENDSLAPQKITYLNPSLKFTQSLSKNAGLALTAGYQKNQVVADSFYMPDTLLREVAEYFDYKGSRMEAKVTIMAPEPLIFYATYNNKDFSSLYAYEKAAADTSSPFTRISSDKLRRDQTTEVGAELTLNTSERRESKSKLILGGSYLINSSNDPYYDYSRFLLSATIEYNF
jgi:hypothetical protein